ncbi:superoxide dismutase [Flavobacterium sp. NRK F10]|uniref:Superoxide dismutase n=1 Tax=Flavobacterium sediminis TaxID=2201181 RepID=A0A2U8QX88_9FLAO|nr:MULTISPECIES: superoxide dismutase [Flavobacterium]AWM14504.1 superoxide dismutase [Flavobacterium sediminis]MCO6175735.1 superoxide dismutase [Flavobacterium sp. NRK F10]
MIKHILMALCFLSLLSCNDNSNLVEVQIPEPEVIVQTNFADPRSFKATGLPFKLSPVEYSFDTFPDFIDGKTFEFHYSNIYLSYTNNLNKQVTEKNWETKKASQICKEINPEDTTFLNFAGGYYNHSLFFETLSPKKDTNPSESLNNAIDENFGSVENFKKQFILKGINTKGSNWIWLVLNNDQKLEITITLNEENPLMQKSTVKGFPLLCLDLWEHAYLLNNNPSKKNYIEAFFTYVDWNKVSERYEQLTAVNPQS